MSDGQHDSNLALSKAKLYLICCYAAQDTAWDAATEERGVEGMPRSQSNPHQDEIDAVGTFFEVEQQLAALQASSPKVSMPITAGLIDRVIAISNTRCRCLAALNIWQP